MGVQGVYYCVGMLMYAHEGSQHDRADVQKRINDAPNELSVHQIRTSDIARLMELFQVCHFATADA